MMARQSMECPDCQTPLRTVLLSDLIGESKERSLEATLPAAAAIFEYFDLYVCGQCGRTLMYAGSEAREVAAKKRAGE